MEPTDYEDIISEFPEAKLLKKGGQKVVFLIDHPIYEKAVLKIGRSKSPSSIQRIEREVNLLRQINSSYYPKNYDFQLLENAHFIIVEEFIESRPLSDCLNEFSTPVTALEFIQSIVQGLKLIWDKRIVHRDLKPDNILVRPSRQPVIIDLGIARLIDSESLTQTYALLGPHTPGYAAPEQMQNLKPQIDFRADQFNLGIILAQLLLRGHHPFDPEIVGSGDSTMHNILLGEWCKHEFDKSSLRPLKPLIAKLLGREPYQRYRMYEYLFDDISELKGIYQ